MKKFFSQLNLEIFRSVSHSLEEQTRILETQIKENPRLSDFYSTLEEGISKKWSSTHLLEDEKNKDGPVGKVLEKTKLLINIIKNNKNTKHTLDKKTRALLNLLSDYAWEFLYAGQALPLIETWYNTEGIIIYNTIQKIGCLMQQLKTLHQLTGLEDFYTDYACPHRADLNVISVGCARVPEQQVYPWIFQIASLYPKLKIQIDLFDVFGSLSADTNAVMKEKHLGVPDIITLDREENINNWESLGSSRYKHKGLKNLSLRAHNFFFPSCDEGEIEIALKLYPVLLKSTQALLKENKMVIFGNHTGAQYIDHCIAQMYNEIHSTPHRNNKNLFILTQCGDLSSRPAYIYNRTIIDLFEKDHLPEIQSQTDPVVTLEAILNDETFPINTEREKLIANTIPNLIKLQEKYKQWPRGAEIGTNLAAHTYLRSYTPAFTTMKLIDMTLDINDILQETNKDFIYSPKDLQNLWKKEWNLFNTFISSQRYHPTTQSVSNQIRNSAPKREVR